MVCGFTEPPEDWDIDNTSESRNAGSVVIRVVYRGRSVLFCGDAVGRHNRGPADQCIATERFMVDNAHVIPIDSDVVIAPHHGADNGSSNAFIQAVTPEWVIFSAGHKHEHPRAAAAQRYLDAGVPVERILRTDRGDDEGDDEWTHGAIPGHRDRRGDDDVDIRISAAGVLTVTQQQ